MARLAVAAGIAGVLTAGAMPALAANNISKFSGSASGSAVNATINPSAVLDVRLNRVQSVINSLNAVNGTQLGLGSTINNLIGSTLAQPTKPITVTVDAAKAAGASTQGTVLTDGSATSTAVAIDAASLATEVDLLNKALKDMPSGTLAALKDALAPLIAADPTGQLATAFNTVLPSLTTPVTGALGSPTVNILQSVNAKFGETVKGNLTTVNQGGLLTPSSKLELQPFEAHALTSDAYAANAVDNLALVPSGRIGVASPQQLVDALTLVETVLLAVEKAVTDTTSTVPVVGSTVGGLTGTVFPVINGQVGSIKSTVGTTLKTTDLTAVNTLISALNSVLDLLSGMNGLVLNDIVGNNGANALSTLGRSNDAVVANGLGQVAHVSVLKINGGALATLLSGVGSGVVPTELVSVDGIKATANVSLDGASAPKQSANGTLVDIKVLGKSLSDLSGGKVALDDILKPGTSCSINIPGKSTCNGIDLITQAGALLDSVQALSPQALPALPTLLSVTLTRGAGVVDQSNNVKYGRADITVLQVTSTINCDTVSKLTDVLGANKAILTDQLKSLAQTLDLNVAACGLGVTDAPAASAANRAKASVATNATGNQPLVNVALGVAHAEVNLDSASITTVGGPVPPTTGNDLLILAGVALAAVAGGIALQVRKARA